MRFSEESPEIGMQSPIEEWFSPGESPVMHSYKKRVSLSGMTLIELIVTIGIIATLAVLGLQGYRQAVLASSKTKCIANLRNIGVAQSLYIASNNGWFVPCRAEIPGVGTVFWCQELLPYLSAGPRLAFPKIGESETLACPIAKGPHPRDPLGYEPSYVSKLSYSQNLELGGGLNTGTMYPPRQKMTSVRYPSKMVLVAEGNRVNALASIFEDPSGLGASYRHGKQLNLLFVDGHVESSRYPITPERGNLTYNWKIGNETN